MYAQGEECGSAGASAHGSGGEGLSTAGPGDWAWGWGLAQPSAFACLLPQETVRQFRGAVGEQLGKMRVFLAALEGSLDREAERVRGEAGVALRRELGSLNSYLEQLRQMEKVLEEVADKPQTEFLMVSTWMTFPLCFSARVQGLETTSHCQTWTLTSREGQGLGQVAHRGRLGPTTAVMVV